ncbi:MAG: hypothetical protein ACLQF0_06860 [Dissulfurispiraceae bacterium]
MKKKFVLTDGSEVIEERLMTEDEFDEAEQVARRCTDGNWYWLRRVPTVFLEMDDGKVTNVFTSEEVNVRVIDHAKFNVPGADIVAEIDNILDRSYPTITLSKEENEDHGLFVEKIAGVDVSGDGPL